MDLDLTEAAEEIRTILDMQNGAKTAGARSANRSAGAAVAAHLAEIGYDMLRPPLSRERWRLEDVKDRLSPHVYQEFRRHGAFRVGDLRNITEDGVKQWNRFGIGAKRELIGLLQWAGIKVNPADWPTFDVFKDA